MIRENFGAKDVIDIVLVALLMYQAYRILRRSGTNALFNGVLALLIIWYLVSQVFQLRLLGGILNNFFGAGIIAVIILFQDELKKFISSLGMHRVMGRFQKKFTKHNNATETNPTIHQIVQACANMAKSKTGALIVIQDEDPLTEYKELGQEIDGYVSSRLIETIFFKNTPLHDGAMLITRNRILATGAILPVSHSGKIPSHLGLRHRAALGMSAQTDAYIIVISEERGSISFIKNSNMELNITPQRLQELLINVI